MSVHSVPLTAAFPLAAIGEGRGWYSRAVSCRAESRHARERPSTSLGTNGNDDMNEMTKLTAADFASDQEVRWCPGCGDYAILKAVQRTMPEIGADPAKTVFVSGKIGRASCRERGCQYV